MSAPPQAKTPNPHTNLLNVYIHVAKKWGFNKKKLQKPRYCEIYGCHGSGYEEYN
jgi:hypothetical protein